MSKATQSLVRRATREKGGKLNILSFPTHERYQTNLAQTGHDFYLYSGPNIKDWNFKFGKLPYNITLLDKSLGNRQIPYWLPIDIVLSQNKFGQFPIAKQIAQFYGVPLISLEHTLPVPNWSQGILDQFNSMSGHINLYISEYSVGKWGGNHRNTKILRHGIDTELFAPGNLERKSHILSVVNDWRNRQWCCGFDEYIELTQNLPTRRVGDTPGFSEAAPSIEALVREYQQSSVFINTSLVSPVPTSLLEAMSCGCACVSLDNCMIPEVIEHGVNGYLTNDKREFRKYLEKLLKEPELALAIGKNARNTILDKFGLQTFIDNWNYVFEESLEYVETWV